MNKSQSLADKISSILSTTPASFDPDDDNHEETAAKVTEGALEDDEDAAGDVLLSSFRKKNLEILEDVDIKYSGKKGNRKNVEDSEEEWESESEVDDSGSDDDNEGIEEEDDANEEINDENEEIHDESEEIDEESEEGMSIDGDDHNFKHIKEENVSGQLKKGLCIRNQLNIWENLLEMRIQMQKCLVSANKMPQKENYNKVYEQNDFKKKVNETTNTLSTTLNKLLDLQSLVWKKYPDTKNLLKPSKNTLKSEKNEGLESDEEIPSDSEVESDENEEDEIKPPKKRIKLLDYEKILDVRHKNYQDYRNSTIQKWNDKTRVGTKSDLQHSVLNQINHILTDRSRLIKRTQTKRSNYEIIGEIKDDGKRDDEKQIPLQEINKEIFDDDDFYHQLLRELIEVKSADLTDPVQLGRQWIQLQNLRSKMKRKVDTKATKGRKIRYTVHTKLVNFMAPIDEGSYTEEAKVELFSSLCGKNEIIHKI